jgi:signal transduction histidine kinase
VISVSDNGIGIDEELQPKIFNMFFRGTNQSKGSGLGLYIVKEAVEKMNGTIQVQSRRGAGSEFIIAIPSAVSTSNATQKNEQILDASRSCERISV